MAVKRRAAFSWVLLYRPLISGSGEALGSRLAPGAADLYYPAPQAICAPPPGLVHMDSRFPKLFSPLTLRGVTLKNRIFSTGHDTNLAAGGLINDRLVAYHRARAVGGAGLVILQVSGVHESARYTSHLLMAISDESIPGYRGVAEAVHAHGCRVFAQLFHPGREIMESQDGSLPVAYAPSVVPNERFHVMPAPLTLALIREIVEGYGAAAPALKVALRAFRD